MAELLLQDLPKGASLLADRGYDADWIREMIEEQDCTPVIPPKSNRINEIPFSRRKYKKRNLVERCINKLKQFRHIATRYDRNVREASRPQVPDYPPPAQVLGVLYNAVFLDLIDQDVLRLQRTNRLVARLPEEQRHGLRVVDMLVRRLIALGEEDAERQWERIAAFVEGEMAAC